MNPSESINKIKKTVQDISFYKFDDKRYFYSFMIINELINNYYSKNNIINILELGGISYFTKIMETLYKDNNNIKIHHTQHCDYRKEIIIDNQIKYDIIICMELIEHLNDLDNYRIETVCTFLYSGITQFFKNINQYIHEDTIMFITTPNINSYRCFKNMIYNKPAMQYLLHCREYSVNELIELLNNIKLFNINLITTFDLMNIEHEINSEFKEDIDRLIKKYSVYNDNNNNSNIILLLSKQQLNIKFDCLNLKYN